MRALKLWFLWQIISITLASANVIQGINTDILAFAGVLLLWLLVGYGLGIVVRRLIGAIAKWVGIGVVVLIVLSALNLAEIDFNSMADSSTNIIQSGYLSLIRVVTSNLVATCFFLLGILLSRGDNQE